MLLLAKLNNLGAFFINATQSLHKNNRKLVVCKLHKIIRYCRRKRGTAMTTGEKLQNLRKENNYTQEELADILGVSRQSISKWESDVAFPETDKLRDNLIFTGQLYQIR